MIVEAAAGVTDNPFAFAGRLTTIIFGQAANAFVVTFTMRLKSRQIDHLVRATNMMCK